MEVPSELKYDTMNVNFIRATSYQSQLKRSHIFTNMYFILVIFVMTASLGQTASESKAKPKVKPGKRFQ